MRKMHIIVLAMSFLFFACAPAVPATSTEAAPEATVAPTTAADGEPVTLKIYLLDYNKDDKNFFFQAEDGIRDLYVTGVQTCALPIFAGTAIGAVVGGAVGKDVGHHGITTAAGAAAGAFIGRKIQQHVQEENADQRTETHVEHHCEPEIGRASCRERG